MACSNCGSSTPGVLCTACLIDYDSLRGKAGTDDSYLLGNSQLDMIYPGQVSDIKARIGAGSRSSMLGLEMDDEIMGRRR